MKDWQLALAGGGLLTASALFCLVLVGIADRARGGPVPPSAPPPSVRPLLPSASPGEPPLKIFPEVALSVETRAVASVAGIATRDGFRLRLVHCEPWPSGGDICDLCYSHPLHYLGSARVWCGKLECTHLVDSEDPRMADYIPDRCEVP